MKKHYGEKEFLHNEKPDWTKAAERPVRVPTPKQGIQQCGHYMLKLALHWNGEEFTKEYEHFNVSLLLLLLKLNKSTCIQT